MNAPSVIGSASAGTQRYWLGALLAIVVAYLLVFTTTRDGTALVHLKSTARNVVSLALTAAIARAIVVRWILRLEGARLWLAHAGAAALFAVTWLWLLTVTAGMLEAASTTRFTVAPFLFGPAEAWQLIQGGFAYVALAALVTLEHRPASGGVIILDNAAPAFRDRFLVRAGEEVTALAAADIVSIVGADDYAEVVTAAGGTLVATTLAEFEQLLDPARFLRVHRSALANLDHVDRAEPVGGGRMRLRMRSGADLPVSRTGARLLRERLL